MDLTGIAVSAGVIALTGAALALAAFLWAVRTGQFSHEQLRAGGSMIFDDEDRSGRKA